MSQASLTYHRAYEKKNKARINKVQRERYAVNREYCLTQDKKYAIVPTQRFTMARSNAKRMILEWTISKEEYLRLLNEGCFYCGKNLVGKETGTGLDRIDNSEGYTNENVLPCCGDCNKGRGDRWSVDEWQVMMFSLLGLRGIR